MILGDFDAHWGSDTQTPKGRMIETFISQVDLCLYNDGSNTFIEIVILWVNYTIPIGFNLFWQFFGITSHILNYFVWLRITDEGSLPEMRIWSISNLIRLKMVYTS